MKTTALLVTLIAALSGTTYAQAPTVAPPEKEAVIADARAYEAAYAKGDVKALADFYTEDADYTAEDGRTVSGRAAIEETIRSALAARKGGVIAIDVESVRSLSPDVLVEKGATTVTANDGQTSGSLYTAVHVKKDGKWKISQLVESPQPGVTPHQRLTELAWLVGAWEEADKADDLRVESEYLWGRGGNFLTRNVVVKHAGETTLEGWQIIGWDPLEERIRSWTFDTEGGFAESLWTREGDRWLLQESGVAPNGARTTAENTITRVSADRLAWESNNRTLDGEPQPSIGRIEINRVKEE